MLEGLGLVCVRQGAGATLQPLTHWSLSVLPHMIHRHGRTDEQAMEDVAEVLNPLFVEMARVAILRHRPAQLAALRHLRDVIADAEREREERFEAARQVFELVSDDDRQSVWQMLARKTTGFLRSGADENRRGATCTAIRRASCRSWIAAWWRSRRAARATPSRRCRT